jgi:ATP-dependent Clp protease protease subunit
MIHQPLGYGGWVQQASDMEIEAREINELKKELYEIISKNSGQKYDKVYKDGDRDYWMTSKDALDYGMIDKVIKSKK